MTRHAVTRKKRRQLARKCPLCHGSGFITETIYQSPPLTITLERPCPHIMRRRVKGILKAPNL